MNTSDAGGSRAAQAASPSKPPPPPMPSTPSQSGPPQSFRDYNQATQPSPGRSISHDYPPQHAPPPAYAASPASAYPPAPYGRPIAPPLQPPGAHDVRSPGSASVPAPSPYGQTPTSSLSGTGGYFPPQATSASPVQRHHYPPTSAYPQRESFSQPAALVGMTGPPGHPSYMQGPPMPQTPPVGTPGSAHPYLHQRSHSTASTPTPTSAQSQHQYGTPFAQGSPVLSHHQPPLPQEPVRHPSQPPSTPLGPPPASQRAPSVPAGYTQPRSPHQQRIPSVAVAHAHMAQVSPPRPAPPSIPRQTSNHVAYEQQAVEGHRRSQSHSERAGTLSVSPKTVPSLPSGGSYTHNSSIDAGQPHIAGGGVAKIPLREEDSMGAVTPMKRKLVDRNLSPEELDRSRPRPQPFEEKMMRDSRQHEGVNGARPSQDSNAHAFRSSVSPTIARKPMPRRYAEPPPWAQRYDNRQHLNHPNAVIRKPGHSHVNGGQSSSTRQNEASRHTSPEAARQSQVAPAVAPPVIEESILSLGQWEESITGERPYEEMPRKLADHFFLSVVNHPDGGDIASHKIAFEIEAKLGTIISRDTNHRISLPVVTECIIADDGRIAFQSCMTEVCLVLRLRLSALTETYSNSTNPSTTNSINL
jgi:hypothetical protein